MNKLYTCELCTSYSGKIATLPIYGEKHSVATLLKSGRVVSSMLLIP